MIDFGIETSMIRLRDIMMSLLKEIKETYDSKPSDIDTSQLTEMMSEMMSVMYELVEEIRK